MGVIDAARGDALVHATSVRDGLANGVGGGQLTAILLAPTLVCVTRRPDRWHDGKGNLGAKKLCLTISIGLRSE